MSSENFTHHPAAPSVPALVVMPCLTDGTRSKNVDNFENARSSTSLRLPEMPMASARQRPSVVTDSCVCGETVIDGEVVTVEPGRLVRGFWSLVHAMESMKS